MMKKIISILLSLVLTFSLIASVHVNASAGAAYSDADIYAADCITYGVCDPLTGSYSGDPNISTAILHKYTYRIIAEEIIDDGLLVFNSVYWQNLRKAIDGKFLEIANWQEALYTVLIMDFLTYQTKSEEYKSNLTKNTIKFANRIYGDILDYADSTYNNDIDEILENVSLSDAIEFSDKYGYVTKLKAYNDLAEDIGKVATSSRDYYKNLSKALAVQQANKTTVDFLLSLKSRASGNSYFVAAVDKVVNWYTASYSTLAFDNAVSTMANYAIEATTDCIVKAYPPLEVVVKGLKTYTSGLNWLFNSDDLSENNLKMILLYTINSYALTALQDNRDNYKSNPTSSNADTLLNTYICYLEYQKYASEHTKGFITSALFDGIFNIIKNLFSNSNELTYEQLNQSLNSDISFVKNLNSLLGKYYDVYHSLLGYDVGKITGDKDDTSEVVYELKFLADKYTLFANGFVVNPAVLYPHSSTNNTVTYRSGNNSIATVDQNGKITAQSPGTVTIYASSGSLSDSCTITVVPFYGMESGEGYIISGYAGQGGNVVIPKIVQEKYIVGIKNDAFSWNRNITGISIPSSVTSIGDYAFYYCSALTSVTIPDSVISLGESAFGGCSDLTDLTLSKNLGEIKSNTFFNCKKLNSVTIPDSVSKIGNYAFSNCSALSNLTVSNNVTEFGQYAFSNCSSLKTVSLPATLTNIGYRSFNNCSNIEVVNVDSNNQTYASIDGVVYNKALTDIILYPKNKLNDEYTFPSSVNSVGKEAFYGNKNLKTIKIPSSVINIGDYAFAYCSSLKTVELPNNIENIPFGLFSGCASIEYINLPKSVKSIGDSAFAWCDNLKNITLPDGLVSIGGSAFTRCSYLKDLKIPNTVNSIGNGAFFGCSSIENLTIPDAVTVIGEETFYECSGLKNITLSKNLKSIGYSAFSNCSSLEALEIPDSVTDISSYCFLFCTNLKTVKIGKGINTINSGNFYGSYNLKSVKLCGNIKIIDSEAFYECSSDLKFRCYSGSSSINTVRNKSFKYSVIYDISGDNLVDAADLTALRNNLLKGTSVTSEADCNEDDRVNLKDLIRIKKYLAGIIKD